MKKIKPMSIDVQEAGDDMSVKVKVESKADVADVIDALISLEDWEFKEAVKCAKQFRKANTSLQKIFDILGNEYERAGYVS